MRHIMFTNMLLVDILVLALSLEKRHRIRFSACKVLAYLFESTVSDLISSTILALLGFYRLSNKSPGVAVVVICPV
ncbi:hypothetical protein BDW72DRAFT_172488 [Aspergillus terricola var. indicus]